MANSLERKQIDINGLAVSYLESGQEGSPCILLLNDGGFGGSAETSFSDLIPLLVEQGYRVVAPDLLGFGHTKKVVFLDEAPVPPQIRMLSGLVSQLGLGAVYLVGNSFGGTVALRNLAAGNPINAAGVCSIGGTGGPWRVAEGMRSLLEYDGSERSMQALVDVLAGSFPGIDKYVAHRNEMAHMPGHYQALVAPRAKPAFAPEPEARRDDFPASLASSDTPILLIAGTDDPTNEDGWWQHIEQVTRSVRTVRMEGRHSPNIDHPEAVAAALVEWINTLGGGSSA